ncbi:glycosyltransferase family 1 protein [Microbacterium bovistercoris]|uniref:D-inositol 3-phosphate glycosyltransferase n=1 Tax=Microbacterium bovistercoris TaxID=2293570 RepID=A0A371NXK3_9MICO|nr:glycosyltransferase family 4 protein [Microbacterium bovistercoris]REJ08034.1 glycosyltransferase family 1 protein [Microbacterium bovistercoris]
MASRPRRIALIASSFAPHIGGVEEHVAQVARELATRGDAVEVWTVDRGERPQHPFDERVVVRYLPTPLPARKASNLARFAVQGPGARRAWARAHEEFRPDVLHVHCFGPNGLYALDLHRRFGTPMVVTSHGETRGDDSSIFARSALLRRGLRDAVAAASVVTAPSEYVLTDLRASYGLDGGVVVPNGVDLDVDAAAPPLPTPYLLAYGRLGRMKGFDLLIEAFARVTDAGIPLVIGGDGPEHEALIEQARGLHVHFPGRFTAEQVAGAVDGAVAVVVPSRSEAFGIVALEAWRGAAPLVMTTRGGAAEFMTDGVDALLVDPDDIDALAAALERLLGDAELRARLAAAGRARTADFSWASVAQRYEELYP